jgi:DNA methylase
MRPQNPGPGFLKQASTSDGQLQGEELEHALGDQPTLPTSQGIFQMPRRFGHVPVDDAPLGWDRAKRFETVYPRVLLPFQEVERVSFGHPELNPNRLYFGDCLHVMRALPSESIDLIYIDPPFFSGKHYNLLFGDKSELRSFSDIWEGGLTGYLVWLNARLYEMKRLLKSTGSIYVHLDWHAAHYVKVEMDKIFGYDNLVNEVIWSYRSGGGAKQHFGRKHDTLLFYAKTYGMHKFFPDAVRVPYDAIIAESRRDLFNEGGKVSPDVWEIGRPPNHSKEWIGNGRSKAAVVGASPCHPERTRSRVGSVRATGTARMASTRLSTDARRVSPSARAKS